jgi:hypothetical protein
MTDLKKRELSPNETPMLVQPKMGRESDTNMKKMNLCSSNERGRQLHKGLRIAGNSRLSVTSSMKRQSEKAGRYRSRFEFGPLHNLRDCARGMRKPKRRGWKTGDRGGEGRCFAERKGHPQDDSFH